MVVLCSSLLGFLLGIYFMTQPRPVYLVDFALHKGRDDQECTHEHFMERSRLAAFLTEQTLTFQKKILERSGLGQLTYFSDAVFNIPPNPCMAEARKEAQGVMLGTVDQLLAKTRAKPRDIGILVHVQTSTLSFSAMIVNQFQLRGNIKRFSHQWIGVQCWTHIHRPCSADPPDNITLNWYPGNNPSMLVTNCLICMRVATILLSNCRSDCRRSKYQLVHTGPMIGHSIVYQEEDEAGKVGVTLSKDLTAIAREALKSNITMLGPLVLHVRTTPLFHNVFKMKVKPYIRNSKLAFEHFCNHADDRLSWMSYNGAFEDDSLQILVTLLVVLRGMNLATLRPMRGSRSEIGYGRSFSGLVSSVTVLYGRRLGPSTQPRIRAHGWTRLIASRFMSPKWPPV
ncbi:3-ketoacyl-CoA synthase 20-like protein [Cinnamomum micranthum f. kanehirae]|uniref:3-ketoacyl-CoA synthase 20-like protein n=1 Tax=Cinnamomum micranthum f. kanehirae TaxID=337451 RepID=A0A443PDL1_9MAGN|nr:3-ketoacyl-CoA synthase 20-like protein [Cinnamomum micranthum f. kanehirae]